MLLSCWQVAGLSQVEVRCILQASCEALCVLPSLPVYGFLEDTTGQAPWGDVVDSHSHVELGSLQSGRSDGVRGSPPSEKAAWQVSHEWQGRHSSAEVTSWETAKPGSESARGGGRLLGPVNLSFSQRFTKGGESRRGHRAAGL